MLSHSLSAPDIGPCQAAVVASASPPHDNHQHLHLHEQTHIVNHSKRAGQASTYQIFPLDCAIIQATLSQCNKCARAQMPAPLPTVTHDEPAQQVTMTR
jgi:hypothetical protein